MSKGSALGCVMISLALLAACSSSKKNSAVDAGMDAGGDAGGKGGMGGASGKGGKGGSGGTTSTGTAGTTTPMMMITCTEDAGTAPITCGGQTCAAPTTFAMNPCVVPCCLKQGGKEVCGSKSTASMFAAECAVPATPDTSCPMVTGIMGAMDFVGCCNATTKTCGLISTLRPGCITMSAFAMLPDPPVMCSGTSDQDGGAEDAGR